MSQQKRSVFFVSDHTGITAETLGRSLLTQYEGIQYDFTSWPFLDTVEKAANAVGRINLVARDSGVRPLIFSTLVNTEVRKVIEKSDGLLIDFFDAFASTLELELGVRSSHVSGVSHSARNYSVYSARIDALNFALTNDDGAMNSNYHASDIILLGVSRSGKTPTGLYMALQFGVLAANYPLTPEDLEQNHLPKKLKPFRKQLFGLIIEPERLQEIRERRLPGSKYAELRQCRYETELVESFYRMEAIPYLNTTNMSIEEIATTIMQKAGLERRLFG
jgi:regulator of PEP synthase PpsR (kinase-PPPase family)